MYKFFVGTKLDDLIAAATNAKGESIPVAMLDGTVPGWSPKSGDTHFDHHKPGGSKIQIDDIPESHTGIYSECVVATTQLDADACVAAAWFLEGRNFTKDAIRKLRAIAYDCDHLTVPAELGDLAEFAAKAVATFKVDKVRNLIPISLGLNPDPKTWSDEEKLAVASEGFKQSTYWLVYAALGLRPYPGELGEADEYQSKLRADANKLISEERVSIERMLGKLVVVGNGTGLGYVDPRSYLMAWEQRYGIKEPEYTLTFRDHKCGTGICYTIASSAIDLTEKLLARLTELERQIDPNADGWGGRATVGGSGWNTPSNLSVEDIVNCISLVQRQASKSIDAIVLQIEEMDTYDKVYCDKQVHQALGNYVTTEKGFCQVGDRIRVKGNRIYIFED